MIKLCSGLNDEDEDSLLDYIESMAADKTHEDWQGVVKFEIRLPDASLFMVTIAGATKAAVKDLLTLSSVCSINGEKYYERVFLFFCLFI